MISSNTLKQRYSNIWLELPRSLWPTFLWDLDKNWPPTILTSVACSFQLRCSIVEPNTAWIRYTLSFYLAYKNILCLSLNQDSLILASDNQIMNILWNMSFLKELIFKSTPPFNHLHWKWCGPVHSCIRLMNM